MRNKIVLGIAVTALMLGCSSKEEEKFLKIYENQKEYHKKLGKTESTELTNGLSSRAVFTATYLFTPTEDKNDTRDEKFIVNLYFNDEEVSYEWGDFNLTLVSKLPRKQKVSKNKKKEKKEKSKKVKKKSKNIRYVKSVKRLHNNDPLLKDISLVSEWNQYYLVTFPNMKQKNLYLILESDFYGHGHLNFAKVSKYVFSKEAI